MRILRVREGCREGSRLSFGDYCVAPVVVSEASTTSWLCWDLGGFWRPLASEMRGVTLFQEVKDAEFA